MGLLSFSFLKQSVLKHALSEGDRFILSIVSSSFDQGVYGIVYNYGSLVARLIFAPLEEVSRTTFANLLQGADAEKNFPVAFKVRHSRARFVFCSDFHLAVGDAPQVGHLHRRLVRRLWLLQYAPADAHSARATMGRDRGPRRALLVLRLYPHYWDQWHYRGYDVTWSNSWFLIFLLAFVYSVATASQVEKMNRLLIGCSIVYGVAAVLLVQSMGTRGLVLANSVNMLLRIAFSYRFIANVARQHGRRIPWASIMPNRSILAVLVGALHASSVTYRQLYRSPIPTLQAVHVGVSAVLAVVLLFVFYRVERSFITDLLELARARRLAREAKAKTS